MWPSAGGRHPTLGTVNQELARSYAWRDGAQTRRTRQLG
jgi:hypothetical protein